MLDSVALRTVQANQILLFCLHNGINVESFKVIYSFFFLSIFKLLEKLSMSRNTS